MQSPSEPTPVLLNPEQWVSEHLAESGSDLFSQLENIPQLKALVDEGLSNNPQLQQSKSQLAASVALLELAQAEMWPEISAYLTAGRQDNGNNIANSAQLGIDFNWEIDLWGKLDDQAQAALLDAKTQLHQYQAAQQNLVATISQDWFNLLTAQQQLALIEQRRDNLQQNLAIIEDGYQSGIRQSLDVFLSRADVAGAQANVAGKQDQLNQSSQALELSLGRYPSGRLRATGELALNIAKLPAGLPSEMLQRRPDIQAEYTNLSAANARIAVAYKQKFPSLRLTSRVGGSSNELNDLLQPESLVWNVFANLTSPLLDAGRLQAQQQQKQALAEAASAQLRNKVLSAFAEVESALNAETSLVEQLDRVIVAADNSIQAEQLAFEQYQAGLVEYVTVLESQRRSFDSQSTRIDIRNLRLQNRINLLLALGGGLPQAPRWAESKEVTP
ncbi:efflux transporter outer membrane subunit [Motilimonas pumila]|uniref:efflux transporter outer membrane subunit n=1 Tax=Motilimonas pumila TaxID=2303987 RepID=UPI00131484C3|nr:efflux transporter outer membrane subunit [Motilimonas pumila]